MKKFGFNGEAAQQKRNEAINSIGRMVEMFQDEMSAATDAELEVMASILLEAGANYVKTVRQMAR